MPAEPRVLIFHPALAPYRIDLFNALDRSCRLRLVFLLRNLPDQKLDQDALRNALVPEHSFLLRGLSVLGRNIRFGLSREIKRFRPDIVITSEFGAASLATTARSGIAQKHFDHVIWTDDNPESIAWDPLLKKILRRLLLPRTAGLVSISDEAACLYREGFGFGKPIGSVPILRNEMLFRRSLQAATGEAIALAKANRLLGSRVLLYVGRLAPEKGLSLLVNSFATLASQMPDARLVLVGGGPDRQELEERVCDLGIEDRIVFAGHAEGSKLLAWYRIGHALILPSRLERFGAVVNEALLAGLPVVCSRYAGARILVRQPENGIIVNPLDPTELRDALLNCLACVDMATIDGIQQLRASKMSITFAESVHSFESLLYELWHPSPNKA